MVAYEDIVDAARQIAGHAVRTPLLEYPVLNERVGGRVLIKFEGAQLTGSFKFRGAYNRLSRLNPEERRSGVVAWSSGNHAQGVAAAAKLLGIRATIVMPSDAPAVKARNTRAWGAEIVCYDRQTESREEIARALVRERGSVLVPSFDDPHIIAGQGTIGLELVEQAGDLRAQLDQLLVCCGGGGLIAGVATAVSEHSSAAIYSVEPEEFDDTARSLRSGNREIVAAGAVSICDALLTPQPGEITFAINQRLLAGGLTVSDSGVRSAMRYAFDTLKLVTEPGGAVALAAVLSGKLPCAGRTTALTISGANVDAAMFAQIISESDG